MAGYLGKFLAEIDDMPVDEFNEWRRYEELEPFGDRRADIHAALIQCTIANWAGRSLKEGAPPLGVKDFLPEWEAAPEVPQSPEKQLQIMTLLQAFQNAIVANG